MPVLQVRLNDEDHAKMKVIADAAGLSASEMVRRWINDSAPEVKVASAKEVEALEAEVKQLKKLLAQRVVNPTPPKLEIREPKLYDSHPESPFNRGGFGSPKPAPKPSSKR